MSSDELRAWLLMAGFKYHRESDSYFYSLHGLVRLITVKFMLLGSVRIIPVYGKDRPLHFSCFKQAQQYIQDLMGEQP